MELAKLALVDRRRRLRQQILRALRLRERDHVANGLGAGQQRAHPVQAERDPAVRRRAVAERLEQEAELRPRLVGAEPENVEDPLLRLRPVDARQLRELGIQPLPLTRR